MTQLLRYYICMGHTSKSNCGLTPISDEVKKGSVSLPNSKVMHHRVPGIVEADYVSTSSSVSLAQTFKNQ